VQRVQIHLRNRIDGDEFYSRTLHGFDDRFGIAEVLFLLFE
jgi:hypothetical protein